MFILASLGGGLTIGSKNRGELIDYYGHTVSDHFDGNNFYGNDGNRYTRDHNDTYRRD